MYFLFQNVDYVWPVLAAKILLFVPLFLWLLFQKAYQTWPVLMTFFTGSLLLMLSVFSVSVCRSNMACADYWSPYVHPWGLPCPYCLLCIQRLSRLLIWGHSWVWLTLLPVYIIIVTVGHVHNFALGFLFRDSLWLCLWHCMSDSDMFFFFCCSSLWVNYIHHHSYNNWYMYQCKLPLSENVILVYIYSSYKSAIVLTVSFQLAFSFSFPT